MMEARDSCPCPHHPTIGEGFGFRFAVAVAARDVSQLMQHRHARVAARKCLVDVDHRAVLAVYGQSDELPAPTLRLAKGLKIRLADAPDLSVQLPGVME